MKPGVWGVTREILSKLLTALLPKQGNTRTDTGIVLSGFLLAFYRWNDCIRSTHILIAFIR